MKIHSDNKTPHKSDEYDLKVRQTIPYYESFHNETIDLINTVNPSVNTWLDTGCGTGSLIDSAVNKFPNCTFILSDPSENMLLQSKNKLEKYKNNKIVFLKHSNTENLQIESSYQPEVITAIQAHHYMNQKGRRKASLKCFDLLKINGIYITFENVKPETNYGINCGLERWMKFQINQGREETEVSDHKERFNTKYFPISISDHIVLLKDIGFRIVELFWFSYMQAGFYAIK